jgi:hypothetical protein
VKIRNLFSTKKRIAAVVGAGAIFAAVGGVAFAFVSTTGTGTGQATGPADPVTVTLTGHTFRVTSLTPASGAGSTGDYSVPFTADNTNNYAATIGYVEVTKMTATTTHHTCSSTVHSTWFVFITATAKTLVPANSTTDFTHTSHTTQLPHIKIITRTVTQLSCTGATFTLTLSSTHT